MSRILASRGAKVTAMDVSTHLIDIARSKGGENEIDYQVHDLSKPFPRYKESFDLVVSNLVLNDVYDYRGFVSTLGDLTKSGARLVLSMNNPYSAVIRKKVENYFDSGTSVLYQGLASEGIKVYFFHRTLEEYITAFRDNGFLLRGLYDAPPTEEMLQSPDPRPKKYYQFPFFMILELIKEG